MSAPLLEAAGLVRSFALSGRPFAPAHRFRAVDGVDLRVERGQTLALVGESGCGKSTVGRMLLRLQEPDEGTLLFDGEDVLRLRGAGLRRFRRRVQVVFQDPFSSLDPRERVRNVLVRPMRLHGFDHPERRAAALMERVGLSAAQMDRLPHEFSGGQRQRIAIARALTVEPELVVCDEPVSALDVSVQAQVVNLLADLQRDTGVALLFISHDLAVVRHLAHRVAVMYAGRVMEEGPAVDLFTRPAHPYTRSLLAAAPRVSAGTTPHAAPIGGEPPDPARFPPGCRFAGRCPHTQPECRVGAPPALRPVGGEQRSACLFASTLPAWPAPAAPPVHPVDARIAAYRRARDAAASPAAAAVP